MPVAGVARRHRARPRARRLVCQIGSHALAADHSTHNPHRSAPGAGARPPHSANGHHDTGADYYELLGVPYTATSAEITRAYRAAMKRVHPDRQRPERRATAEERAKLLNRAYATLSRPLLRQKYDQQIRARVVQDQIMRRYVGGFMTPDMVGDQHGQRLRREPTPAERRAQERAGRHAMVSILIVVTAITIAIVVLLLVLAVASQLVGSAF